jgi:LPXTG-site transpeptidase (sortase) family protein
VNESSLRSIRRRPPFARRIEWTLWVFGFVALAIPATSYVQARFYQREQNLLLNRALANPSSRSAPLFKPEEIPAVAAEPATPIVIGRLEIPRLGLSTIVREGVDETTLKLAVGHIPRTPFPWQPGNVGLAGHRDTFFRSLEGIRKNDLIRMTTLKGITTYRVESFRIVQPDEISVLDPSAGPMLTLVTCYPFAYVGSAPQRFIVRACGVKTRRSPQSLSPFSRRAPIA